MANEIIDYVEMCRREKSSLQRGMNFELGSGYSVILMSVQPKAPYRDRVIDDGSVLIYEGHDIARSSQIEDPKRVDQPERTPKGLLTQNGKFLEAARRAKDTGTQPHPVRVYEKIRNGIWSYNGVFHLVDGWREKDQNRTVFKFKLVATEAEEVTLSVESNFARRRLIPTAVKVEVWKRDRGRCVACGATDELHFDHVVPYSLGGTSITPANVQLLCARHNLSKGARLV
jgi:hypothetical protein